MALDIQFAMPAEIVQIISEDIQLLIRIKLSDLRLLHTAMQMATITKNPAFPRREEASGYFCRLYEFIDKFLEEFDNGS